MKNTFRTIILSALLLSLWACSDDDPIVTANTVAAAELIAPEGNTNIVLDPANPGNPAVTLVWNHGDYGVETVINYEIELAASQTDFANAINMGATTNRFITWTVNQLNNAAIQAGLTPFEAGSLDVRVKSTIGVENVLEQISDPISITVTPFSNSAPRLAVPGDHQGWNPSEDAVDYVPYLAASAPEQSDFEGFVALNNEFKFVGADAGGSFQWGNTDWGDASGVNGSYTQVLTDDGEGNCGTANAGGPGYYFIQADTEALTYTLTKTSWGIIGNATPTGWDSDTDMVYDESTRTWSVTIDLIPQEAPDNGFKFRANDVWDLNLGDDGADGIMDFNGGSIGVAEAGNYTITIDLSNPRAYTYTVVKN
ncbi:SusE domain-containing protein [Ascidiimonas aurantiaca]|uniref:SusE domain-containing protein n=1 Tax=Ascidiimonas aurantiaca TaxID=1685432 RepID=UPI0030ED86FA